jgi:hypothetical protein
MYEEGAVLTAHSGFFRAAETAAWHTATAVCFLLLLSSMRKLSRRQIALAAVVIVALMTIGVLDRPKEDLRRGRPFHVHVYCTAASIREGRAEDGRRGLPRWDAELCRRDMVRSRAVLRNGCHRRGEIFVLRAAQRFRDPRRFRAVHAARAAIRRVGRRSVRMVGGGLGVASQGTQHFGGGRTYLEAQAKAGSAN